VVIHYDRSEYRPSPREHIRISHRTLSPSREGSAVQTPTRSSSLSSTEPSGPIIVVLVWCLVLLSLCAARPFIAAARGKGDDIEVVRITPPG